MRTMRRTAGLLAAGWAALVAACAPTPGPTQTAGAPAVYDLAALRGVRSRSISDENLTGEPGMGGRAEGALGVGRKGSPMRVIANGERSEIANIEGDGTIRHIWMTTQPEPHILRGAVIRVWWDDQEHPSIEAPLGDFFGFAHGYVRPYSSAVHSIGALGALNIWLPMPFTRRARIEIENESGADMWLYYSIDYTLGDGHGEDVGRLHTAFRRENPTTLREDFEIMPHREGEGRFIGATLGIRPIEVPRPHVPRAADWYGEGELKIYMDGDTDYPTIAGTGSEDYVGLSWGMQATPFPYHGGSWFDWRPTSAVDGVGEGYTSMYRWHLLDPIVWHDEIRVTMQQIGCCIRDPDVPFDYQTAMWEREDDWSAAAFWYERLPSAPLPAMPDAAARLADLPELDGHWRVALPTGAIKR